MRMLNKFPQLATSAMLLAPELDEHYQILATYFNKDDTVLDVGCGDGSFAKHIGAVGVDENTDLNEIDLTNFDTLLFCESLGYLSWHEFLMYFNQVQPKKIVLKDFLSTEPVDVPYFNYNFQTFYFSVLPFLIKQGYRVNMTMFNPNFERWMALLEQCGLEYFPALDIKNIIAVFERTS